MKNSIFKIVLFLAIILFLETTIEAKESYKRTISELEQYYSKALKDWKVPGMAIAIVKNNEVIFAKGFGVKNINTGEKVDKNSLFAIASNTKAFTSASIAMLVDEGKLSWDDKVTQYLPWFELYSPYVTHEMTIRDLLSHRSGLRTFSGDLIWYGTDHSREEIVRRAKYLKPAYGFRAQYGYQNIMFIAAGLVIEKVSGMTWDDFVKSRIFDPLKMNRSITSISKLESKGNFTSPHNDYKEKTIVIDYLNWDNAAPLGGILSSVSDISKWMMLQLNHGITGTDTLFSAASQHQMWQAHTSQNVSAYSQKMYPSTHFKAYGLGWGLMDYRDKKIVSHGGGYDGMISRTVLVPEENLGFVILTNTNTSITSPLMYKTLDVFLSEDDKDWSKLFLDRANRANDNDPEEGRIKNTKASFDLKSYTGVYGGKVYGKTEVYLKDGTLMLQMKNTEIFKGTLTHWHYDTFELEFKGVTSLPKGKVQFKLNAEGEIDELVIDVPNPDFDFTELDFKKLK
jgi:CubicO group peptidase (beta-lactamase class C family)